MVSPRIWVGCAAGDDSQQGMALTQQLISDLQKVGAEVVSERVPLSDEQFLPLLQQELASCQWFILVQTPQGMGSRHVQLALQEAHSFLKSGSLRGACLISVSSEGRGDSAPWPEIRFYARLYAYNGDYLRLRDKLLLDLGLLQITGMLRAETGEEAIMGTPPPLQQTPNFQSQAAASTEQPDPFQEALDFRTQAAASAEQPVLFQEALDFRPDTSPSIEQPDPFQEVFDFRPDTSPSIKQPSPFQGHGENWYKSSFSSLQPSSFGSLKQTGSMASQRGRKRGRGDRPVAAPLFIMPKLSRRFWLYSAVSLFIVALLLTSTLLVKSVASAFTSSAQSTPITLTHSNPTHAVPTNATPTTPSSPTQPAPAQPAPAQPAPSQPAPGQPAPGQSAPPVTCYGQAFALGTQTLNANTVYELPGGAPWFVTSGNCLDINVNFSQLSQPIQMQVCFIKTNTCNAWQTVSSTGTWYQIATSVLAGTSYRFGIKTGGSATTYTGQVAS